MAKLYEIVQEIEDFEFEIDEETGEILNFADLDALELERDTKIENLCLWHKNLLSDAEAYKKEEDSFKKKKQSAEKKAESVKNYIQYILAGNKFKTTKVDVSYRTSNQVEVVDVNRVPAEYLKITQTIEPKKVEIKKAIKNGIEIDGCCLVEKKNLQIK